MKTRVLQILWPAFLAAGVTVALAAVAAAALRVR